MNQHQIQIGQEIFPPTQQNQFGLRYQITSKANAQNNDSVYFAIEKYQGNNQREVSLKFKQNISESEKNFLDQMKVYQNQYDQEFPSKIIKILNFFEYKQYYVLVMEKGEVDLFTHLQQHRINLSPQEKIKICLELTKSTIFLHTNKVMHRNIKPEHYLKVGEQFKLIGFGKIKIPQCDRILTKGIGTLIFQAPEIIEAQKDYSDKIDIWSLGCVFYEIFNQNPLFDYNNYQQIQEKILNHKKNQQEINNKINKLFCDGSLKKLMIQMLQPDPNLRFNSQQVKEELEKIQQNQSQNFNQQNNLQVKDPSPNQQFQQQQSFNNVSQGLNNFPLRQIINPEVQPRINYNTQHQQKHLQMNSLINQNTYQQQQQNFNRNQQNFPISQSIKNIEELMDQKFNEQFQKFKIEIGQQMKTILQDHIEKLFKQYFEQLNQQSFFEKIKENNDLIQNQQQLINNIYNNQMNQNNGINQQQMNQIIQLLESQKSELQLLKQNQYSNKKQQNELQAKIQIDKDNFNLKVNQIQEPFQNPESTDKKLIDFLNQLKTNIALFDFLFEEICLKKNEQIMEKIIGFQGQFQKQGKPDESFSNNIQKIIQQQQKYLQEKF